MKHARGEANVRGSMDEEGKRGKMLPKHVEQLYEEFEARIANEIKGGKSKEQAEVVAQFEVWAKAKPELLAHRPKPGSGVDKQAREDARRRLAVMPTSVKKENGLEEAQEAGEKVEGAFGKAEKVLGVVSWAAKVGGSKTTASMRESFGEEKGFDDKQMVSEGLTTPEGGETKIPIVGEDIEAIEQAKLQVSKGVKTIPPGEVPHLGGEQGGRGLRGRDRDAQRIDRRRQRRHQLRQGGAEGSQHRQSPGHPGGHQDRRGRTWPVQLQRQVDRGAGTTRSTRMSPSRSPTWCPAWTSWRPLCPSCQEP